VAPEKDLLRILDYRGFGPGGACEYRVHLPLLGHVVRQRDARVPAVLYIVSTATLLVGRCAGCTMFLQPMIEIPTGTLTFLFTDVEGSTKLWERDPEAMSRALSRHDELVRNTVETHGGFVFKTVGDAFYVAFSHGMWRGLRGGG
jgi:class 3 adenylate cyclase